MGSIEGFWTVEFGSTTGRFGAGVVVFLNGGVMGGDNGYFYLGTYESLGGNEFRAVVDITPFVPGIESVFGALGRPLKLVITGTLTDESHAIAQGQPAGMPNLRLGVKLTKRK